MIFQRRIKKRARYNAGNFFSLFFSSEENGTSFNELCRRNIYYSRETIHYAEFDGTHYYYNK